jgi:hypothetical protein
MIARVLKSIRNQEKNIFPNKQFNALLGTCKVPLIDGHTGVKKYTHGIPVISSNLFYSRPISENFAIQFWPEVQFDAARGIRVSCAHIRVIHCRDFVSGEFAIMHSIPGLIGLEHVLLI